MLYLMRQLKQAITAFVESHFNESSSVSDQFARTLILIEENKRFIYKIDIAFGTQATQSEAV